MIFRSWIDETDPKPIQSKRSIARKVLKSEERQKVRRKNKAAKQSRKLNR